MADKKLVATTVRSREKALERRNEMMTTSSHDEKTTKKQESNIIRFPFNSKDSKKVFFTRSDEDTKSKDTHKAAACEENKRKREMEKAEAVQDKDTDTSKSDVESSSSSKNSPLNEKEERHKKTTFIVLQKTRGQ